jgi:hypothetical protein
MNRILSSSEEQITLEQHLEREALRACESSSLEQCLQIYGIASTIQVVSPRGKQVTLQAKDIVNVLTWTKFLTSIGRESGAMLLSTEGPELIERYQDWLLHDYTDRYHWIATKSQRVWLEQVVTIVVVRHVMAHKYHRYLLGDQQAFADAGTFASLDRIYLRHGQYGDIARCVKKMIQEPERQQPLIEEYCTTLSARLQNLPPLVWEPLPPLPGELPQPYLLLMSKWVDANE